ncbi:hypothetical protein JTE90_004994 [Oedothorax gibbosus]|uniref:Uncharacterized protein n=1 Tax=Oedothorax gibbosus TaxID=931172 RepID=A0AAV6VAQ1_9ARAC|nr:hypothetical protein JTE90_004994 [Oedothorax gibbosus]
MHRCCAHGGEEESKNKYVEWRQKELFFFVGNRSDDPLQDSLTLHEFSPEPSLKFPSSSSSGYRRLQGGGPSSDEQPPPPAASYSRMDSSGSSDSESSESEEREDDYFGGYTDDDYYVLHLLMVIDHERTRTVILAVIGPQVANNQSQLRLRFWSLSLVREPFISVNGKHRIWNLLVQLANPSEKILFSLMKGTFHGRVGRVLDFK